MSQMRCSKAEVPEDIYWRIKEPLGSNTKTEDFFISNRMLGGGFQFLKQKPAYPNFNQYSSQANISKRAPLRRQLETLSIIA